MNPQAIVISEFGFIYHKDTNILNEKFLSAKVNEKKHFDELVEFAKTDDGQEVFRFANRGTYLQAKNYVGTIQTKKGLHVEILPKTLNFENLQNLDDKEGIEKIKKQKEIFTKLLKILYKLPNYKHIDKAKLSTCKKPIFEIYISMFLDEVSILLKKGLKSDYINKEENLFFLKGKLIVKEQIRKNLIHKERFFVEYDEYSLNRVENRLIKTTLLKLLKLSRDYENTKRARQYLEHMSLVEISQNIDMDFRACKINSRGMKHYSQALIWAKIFLRNETFSTFSGGTIAFALLYPMEKLFECFVEWYLRNKSEFKEYTIISQHSKKVFVKDLFGIRPDFVIKKDKQVLHICDAKWKLINKNKDFSQSDFYQMFAYYKIFEPKLLEDEKSHIKIYYPKTDYLEAQKNNYEFFRDGKIKIVPINIESELYNFKS